MMIHLQQVIVKGLAAFVEYAVILTAISWKQQTVQPIPQQKQKHSFTLLQCTQY